LHVLAELRSAAPVSACLRALNPENHGDKEMTSGKTDEIKGRLKEAAGVLTGDAKLKREGRLDQTVGKTKQAADKAIEKVRAAVK
jgi:uncharacterized protein YjbJ (UPF0337 family)